MQKIKNLIANWCSGYGIDVFKLRRGLKGTPRMFQDFQQYKMQLKSSGEFPFSFTYPCPADRFEEGGIASGHYFHQDLLVARKIFEREPLRHVDIGSRLDGFVAHVASYREIEVLDFRPITKECKNVTFRQFDLMAPAVNYSSYCDSLSCLHTLEHLGLGRYGDEIMVEGYVKGLQTLWSILKPSGILYLSVPIGTQRIEFNAHRVFSVRTMLDLLEDRFDVTDFSYVDDGGDLHENVPLTDDAVRTSFDCWYGCGIFELHKRVD